MKKISKNILLVTLLVLVNLAIFLFCKILTDEGNFIWSKIDPTKRFLVSMACMDLMRIKYFVYANSINFFLLGTYFAYYYRKTLGVLTMVLGVLIFFGGNKLFKEEVVRNYYIIFKNQKVPEDFVLEPVKSAGEDIGKYLMSDVRNILSPVRKYAITGVGEIRYAPATNELNEILHDLKEKPEIRGEAYLALVKIGTERSASYVRIFIGSIHPPADQATIDYLRSKGRALK
ncbi:MAG TPA: HEAT repeat domain-containing protein [Cytophagaceae bacterium]|nr:HEAT repeat domain-containing protein [Cytophagaceae bacterium]